MKRLAIITIMVVALPFQSSRASSQLTLQQPTDLKFQLSRVSLAGGATAQGTVILNRAAVTTLTVNVTSSNTSVLMLNTPTVTVQAGQTTSNQFYIATTPVTQNTAVQFSGSTASGISRTITVQVTVKLTGVTTWQAGTNTQNRFQCSSWGGGLLSLSGSPPAGARAHLTSSNPQVLRFGAVPFPSAQSTLNVDLTAQGVQFAVVTGAISQDSVTVTVTAHYNGLSVQRAVVVTKPCASGPPPP